MTARAAIVGVSGLTLTRGERALFREAPPLGVILFGRNIGDPAGLHALVTDLREAVPGVALMVDQEGGRVARLRPPHWGAHPSAAEVGAAGQRAAWLHGAVIGAECAAAGFDIVAAPVLDLRVADADAVVGDRAFGADAARVAGLGRAMAEGLRAAGVVPVMKHVPGHGRATADSHATLPSVGPEGFAEGIAPFAANADLPWAMTAHVVYRGIDDRPATVSPVVVERVIRGMIGFGGILMTDDLAMRALMGTAGERARAAFAAGCDVALHCSGVLAETAEVLAAAAPATERMRAAARGRAVAMDLAALRAERAASLA